MLILALRDAFFQVDSQKNSIATSHFHGLGYCIALRPVLVFTIFHLHLDLPNGAFLHAALYS